MCEFSLFSDFHIGYVNRELLTNFSKQNIVKQAQNEV